MDKVLKNNGLFSYPWLINHKERESLSNKGSYNETTFKVFPVSNREVARFLESFSLPEKSTNRKSPGDIKNRD